MKKFMKQSLMVLFASLAVAMTSCTKDEMPNGDAATPVGDKITVKAYISNDETKVTSTFDKNDDDTKSKYTFAWEENDKFSAIRNGHNVTFTKVAERNAFTGGNVDPEGSGPYYAIYPVTAATDHLAATFDISNQTNDAAYVLQSSTNDVATFNFKQAMAYLRLSLPDEFDGATCDITIFTPAGVFTDGTINLEDGKLAYTNSSKNYIKLTRQIDKDNPLLVAIPPMEAGNKTLSFSIKKGDVYYEAILSGDASKNIVAGAYYSATLSLTEVIPYITFIAAGPQGVKYNGTDLEWSTDRTNWSSVWTNYVQFGNGTKVYVRAFDDGDNETVDNSDGTSYSNGTGDTSYSKFSFQNNNNVPVACTGDIRTLIDGAKYKTVDTGKAKFGTLFKDCKTLTTAPELPATTLAGNCYELMFQGCKKLTIAPALPAEKLTGYCYNSMFLGCTELTTAPALPATTLAEGCYKQMFYNCSGLTSAPALPATTLYASCYNSMFYGCTSLTAVPILPATTLADRCYQSMFSGCTGLTTALILPATTLAERCYQSMFSGCTGLTTAPILPATTLAERCYESMFMSCTQLTKAPDLPATILVVSCYETMFTHCKNLNSIKAMFTTDPIVNNSTASWLLNVAATGIFVKNPDAEWDENDFRSNSQMPINWNVVKASNQLYYILLSR